MDTLPPVSYYFQLSVEGAIASFQEVSGISMDVSEDENIGENQYIHKIPTAAKQTNLVLKRGLALQSSPLVHWLKAIISSDLNRTINPKTMQVSLLDPTRKPLKTWTFHQAYPVRWEISDLKNESNTLAIETLELAYTYFEMTT